MTSPTDHRARAAAATAARAQNQAPPPPQPFPNRHPPPTNNQTDPFEPPVAGPSHAPDDSSSRDQVAALRRQMAAISAALPLTRHGQNPIQPPPTPPVLGSAAIAQLCDQAAALQPLIRYGPASVQTAPPPVVGSEAVAELHTVGNKTVRMFGSFGLWIEYIF